MKKGLVAVSGGVDSTAALLRFCEQGILADAVIMQLDKADDLAVSDARSACDKLGAELIVLDLRDRFKKEVIEKFIAEYKQSRTPNPCIFCNNSLKFGFLADYAEENGYNFLASGHYVRTEKEGGNYYLKKARDPRKDQSYVLYGIKRELLPFLRFPMGDITKEEARLSLLEKGFSNADKKDSQDICFIPNGKYAEFIEEYTGETFESGAFLDKSGKKLGEHKGLIRYTIGQRKGLGLALERPMYVCELDSVNNNVILGYEEDLMSNRLRAQNVNLLADITDGMSVTAKARYAMKESEAKVFMTGDREIEVEFAEPQRAITSGQSVVLYDGDIVLGGGIIM